MKIIKTKNEKSINNIKGYCRIIPKIKSSYVYTPFKIPSNIPYIPKFDFTEILKRKDLIEIKDYLRLYFGFSESEINSFIDGAGSPAPDGAGSPAFLPAISI